MDTLTKLSKKLAIKFVELDGPNATIKFKLQDGPIKEVGENGCQIDNLGLIWLRLIQGFNKDYPCRENAITITKIEEALMWQEARTKDREKRQVEGLNKK